MNSAVARRAPYPVRSNHKHCAKCRKLVSRAALQCRRCGKRQRLSRSTIGLMASAFLMTGMFAIAAASGLRAPPRQTEVVLGGLLPPGNEGPAGTKPGRHAPTVANGVEVSASDLWMEYARDPADADRRFRDRPVVVSGTVRSVDRDFDGRLMVRLSTGDALETVNAKLAMRNDPAVVGLAKGRPLSLGCVGRGALIGAPLLGGCSVL